MQYKVAVFSDSVSVNTKDLMNESAHAAETINLGNWLQHARPAAPYKVSELFIEHGYDSTVYNYLSYWETNELLSTLDTYSEGKPLVCAFSLTLNTTEAYLSYLRNLILQIKDRLPGSIAIVGGIRPNFNTELNPIGDIMYVGRSMDLLMKSIHDRIFDNLVGKTFEPFVVSHNDGQNLMDSPVIHKFYDHDNWGSTDVAMFETSVGCRFNCTFCNYDFRSVKNPIITEIDRLTEYFSNANSKGITHFFAADDTINETDEKIEIIHKAVIESGIQPNISAYTRQDILQARPHQIDLMSKAGITNLFFGIESFNHDANKMIRKGARPERIIENLRNLKSANPNFFLHGANILGLTGDNKESIQYHIDLTLSEQLLDGITVIPLILRDYAEMNMWEFQSEIDTNPSKYGYTMGGVVYEDGRTYWENNWTNRNEMNAYAGELIRHIINNYGLQAKMGPWTYTCLQALNLVSTPANFKEEFTNKLGTTMRHIVSRNPVDRAIKRYIKSKKK